MCPACHQPRQTVAEPSLIAASCREVDRQGGRRPLLLRAMQIDRRGRARGQQPRARTLLAAIDPLDPRRPLLPYGAGARELHRDREEDEAARGRERRWRRGPAVMWGATPALPPPTVCAATTGNPPDLSPPPKERKSPSSATCAPPPLRLAPELCAARGLRGRPSSIRARRRRNRRGSRARRTGKKPAAPWRGLLRRRSIQLE
ncbi:unnamed protein product [Urochloa humidicola]